jgi:hypothetical protein
MGLLGAIIGGIAISILAAELVAWAPRFARLIAKFAASRLSPAIRERWEVEWLTELPHIPGTIGQLIWAVGLVVASGKLNVGEVWRPHAGKYALLLSCWNAVRVHFCMRDSGADISWRRLILEIRTLASFSWDMLVADSRLCLRAVVGRSPSSADTIALNLQTILIDEVDAADPGDYLIDIVKEVTYRARRGGMPVASGVCGWGTITFCLDAGTKITLLSFGTISGHKRWSKIPPVVR